VARHRARLAPKQAEDRHADALAERGAHGRPLPDGMAELNAVLAADDLAAVLDVLNTEAHRLTAAGDHRSPDQLRADTLVDRILDRTESNRDGAAGAGVHVTLAFSTLTGRDDQPGELAGYGPIPASMARRIAARPPAPATWTTRSPGTTTVTRTSPTSSPNAPDTTTSNTTPTGQSNDSPTAPSAGHHPPDTNTTDPSTPCPSTAPPNSYPTPTRHPSSVDPKHMNYLVVRSRLTYCGSGRYPPGC
jgi:hypothetical protein